MIDAKTIEELQGLLAKATPGPWFMIEKDGRFLFEIMSSSVYVAETSWHDASPIFPTKEGSKANFDLIVAMRNALPALLDLASKTLASAREGEDSPAGILDVQRMLTIHQPTGWLARDIAIASARLQPQVSASGGEVEELCERLKVYSLAEDIMSSERRDFETAAARIRALSAENERLKTMLTGGNLEIVESEQAWKLRAESSEALVAELREKVERLRKALEPFAKAASDYERQGEFFSDSVELVLRVSVFAAPEYHNSTAVQVGDLRGARTALEGRDA